MIEKQVEEYVPALFHKGIVKPVILQIHYSIKDNYVNTKDIKL